MFRDRPKNAAQSHPAALEHGCAFIDLPATDTSIWSSSTYVDFDSRAHAQPRRAKVSLERATGDVRAASFPAGDIVASSE